jgi:hypothetical protein
LRDELKIRVFENRVLRAIFGSKKDEIMGSGENYITISLMICTPHTILFGWKIKKYEMGGTCSAAMGRGEAYTAFW